MKLKLFLLTIILSMSCAEKVSAQELIVKDIRLLSSDMTAKEQPCLTYNGDTCALVKFKGDGIEGLEFTDNAQYIDKRYDKESDTYLVYVYRTPKLTVKHKDYLIREIDMSTSGYKKPKNGKTYLVRLEAKGGNITGSIVMLKVSPINAILTFNGKPSPFSADGLYEFTLSPGNYTYSAKAGDYSDESGTITVVKGENKSVAINLKPIMHEVDVKCNIRSAKVYVDDNYYGLTGNISLPQGKHRIRVQANGYVDQEETILISSNTKMLPFRLEKTNEKHVHATPVKIYSNSKRIYKNGKVLKNWYNGAEIKFMPGKYGLSDENLIIHEVTIGSKPMTIIINGNAFEVK